MNGSPMPSLREQSLKRKKKLESESFKNASENRFDRGHTVAATTCCVRLHNRSRNKSTDLDLSSKKEPFCVWYPE